MAVHASDKFVESIDPGLLAFKEELYCHAVTSEETLRYLRPREVREMKLPEVYKRMLIDRIVKLQTPESKMKMKVEAESPDSELSGRVQRPTKAKRLHFDSDEGRSDLNAKVNVNTEDCPWPEQRNPDKPAITDKNYLERELEKMRDERDSLTILLAHKQNTLKDMRVVPEPLHPIAIPGGILTKTVCDNCHHRGHKSTGNRGGQACPFDACDGYSNCGILTKHKEYKALIQEAEKEVSALEKDVRTNEEKINSLQTFLQTNTSNFVKMVKPRLQMAFLAKYKGKDGNQALQKDLRFIKLATEGKIPANITAISPTELRELIATGERMVSRKFKLDEKPNSVSVQVSQEKIASNESTAYACGSLFSPTPQGMYNFTQQPTSMYPYWSGIYPSYPGMWYGGSPVNQPHTATCTVSKNPDEEKDEVFPPLPTVEYPPLPPLPPLPPQKSDI